MPAPKRFRPQVVQVEDRCVPATVVPRLGQSSVFLTLSATQGTTQEALLVPDGNTVQMPAQPVVPPSPCQQAVLAFEQANGTPPSPIVPGPLIAAGFITPSADFLLPGGGGGTV